MYLILREQRRFGDCCLWYGLLRHARDPHAINAQRCLMVRTLWITGLVGVCGTLAWAQLSDIPPSLKTGLATIQAETLRRDLTYVASDALEGRMSLAAGDEKAIAWVSSEFGKAGLRPAATNASGKATYLQTF